MILNERFDKAITKASQPVKKSSERTPRAKSKKGKPQSADDYSATKTHQGTDEDTSDSQHDKSH